MNTSLQIINFKQNCKEEWYQRALQSVKNEPVKLCLYEGSPFGPLHLRQDFFEKCKTPYLGWVDDDDELVPGTVQLCVDFLEKEENKNLCGVYTDFSVIDENSNFVEKITVSDYEEKNIVVNGKRPFHFLLLRTEAAKHSLKIPAKFHGACGGDTLLISTYSTLFGDWGYLPIEGYIWRNRKESNGKNIRGYDLLIAHCRKVINNKHLFKD